jgi:DNA polymerase-3 subunit epsilon
MREIVLDTETTGIDPKDGHRIIEIGALELVNHMPTGAQLHIYINPEREIDAGAVAVHGLTNEFLDDKPLFAEIVDEFLTFIGEDPMVIHNAPFDMGFINAELERMGRATLPMTRAVDTLTMARRKFPGAQANLNALCRRFEIDNTHRDLHGALVDADLLAAVYIELLGGRQPDLSLEPERAAAKTRDKLSGDAGADGVGAGVGAGVANGVGGFALQEDPSKFDRPHAPSETEKAAHARLLESFKDPVWHR